MNYLEIISAKSMKIRLFTVLYICCMFKRFIPFAHATSIYDIEPDFFLKNSVKILFVDLDNTLDSYKLFHPTEKSVLLIKRLQDNGIKVIIVSNNKGKRVGTYANDLGIDFMPNTMKPFSFKLKKYIKQNNINVEEAMMVGDQMMTDVLAAKGAGLRVILTDKIVKEDQWTTHINRIFGRRIRKYHLKKGNLVDWRIVYGKN